MLQHPPLASGTYNSALTPLASGTHYSTLATSTKIAVSDGSNAHHFSDSWHWPLVYTTDVWHLLLSFNAHHLAAALTTWLQYSPLGSNAHHLATVLTTWLPLPCASSANHSTPAIFANHAMFIYLGNDFQNILLCLSQQFYPMFLESYFRNITL